jgi:hypothetical protein
MTDSLTTPSVTIMIGVPGPWQDATELAHAIASTNLTYRLRSGSLHNPETGEHFTLELMDHDPQLRGSYETVNRRSLSSAELNQVGRHVSVAYLIAPGGSMDAARKLMHAASALLQAGGYAVKVETAGIAHSARDWLAHSARCDTHEGALYIAYVALVGGKGNYYSCGMHNLGCPDAIVTAEIGAARAGELMRDFLMSLVHDPHQSLTNGTLITDVTGAQYQLSHEPCRAYPPDDLYFNPFGMWRLTVS